MVLIKSKKNRGSSKRWRNVLSGGHDSSTAGALLNTLPIEITFVDDNSYQSLLQHKEGQKVFQTPSDGD